MRENRNDLCEEAPVGDAGQIVCLILFIAVWIADSFIFKFTTFLSSYIPLYINFPITAVLLVLCFYFGINAHNIVFKEVRKPPAVIKKRVFKLVRHPLYLASLLLYFSLIISTLSMVSLLLWVGIFLFYNYIAAFEERKLVEMFGKDYIKYKKEVPRWIPRLFRVNSGPS